MAELIQHTELVLTILLAENREYAVTPMTVAAPRANMIKKATSVSSGECMEFLSSMMVDQVAANSASVSLVQ